MADVKITDYTPLAATPADNDKMEIVDVSGPSSKSVTIAWLKTTLKVAAPIGSVTPSTGAFTTLNASQKLNLPATTSATTGVIYKGTNRFIHNFSHPTGDTAVPAGRNTFIGVDAGNFTTGSTATSVTMASYNTALGYAAGHSLTTGGYNTAIGYAANYALTTGSHNTAMGYFAASGLTIGNHNTALGHAAGRYLANGSSINITTDNSIYIGSNTKASADGVTNENVLGYNATGTGSNSVTLGNSSIVKTVLNGRVGIGTTSPATSAGIEISSTTKALLLSRMTTTQRNALTSVNGMIIYNSTLNKFQGYENGAWVSLI